MFQALKELNIAFSQIAVGQRLRLQPAADHGAGQFVGLRVRGAVAGRRLADRPRRRGARPDDLGAGSAEARRRLHDLRRLDAADQPQARPRARPGAGRLDLRHLLRDADGAGRRLHQRLQPVRPHLAGEGPGRGRRPRHDQRRLPRARALVERRTRAAAGGGQHRADHRALLDRALQQPALGGDERRAGAGLLLGRGDRRHGEARQGAPCPPATATNGPARRCRRRRPAARPASSWVSPWSSPTSSWSASTRARPSRSPPCCR